MTKRPACALLLLAALAANADPAVTDVMVRQRWPWNGKVDIDYTLDATTACDVMLQATYVGCMEPIVFTNGVVGRTPVGVAPGAAHLVWDPADSGLDGRALANFTVTGSAASVDERKYLVVNLASGGYAFASSPPPAEEGGWTNALYKSSKMVFRRIPAGSYQLGHTSAELNKLNVTAAQQQAVMARREVTISSDYYIAIFVMTAAQYNTLTGKSPGTTYTASQQPLEVLRGICTNATDAVLWPATGHHVAANSIVARLRARAGLPSWMVLDLPTESQWEIASRAGTTTIFPAGGSATDTVSDLLGYLGRTTCLTGASPVACFEPNAWGIYDPIGIYWELVLESWNAADGTTTNVANPDFRDATQTTDPIGKVCVADETIRAISCNSGYLTNPTKLSAAMSPACRAARMATQKCAARFCIHLNPLVK